MTDLNFGVLQKLYNTPNRTATRADLLNADITRINQTYSSIKDLVSFGLVETIPGTNQYRLTTKGVQAFESSEKERKQASKHERQQRFQNKMSVASLLVPLITFFLGIIVEHKTKLFSFLVSIFK